ncbi:MAG: hypothetical protein ABI112_06445, partial [Terracoccus sp.]
MSLTVAADLASAARARGGVVLRDEELTPLARLDLVESETAPADDGILRGTLTRLRERESGTGRQDAVTAGDLWPEQRRTVVVLGRPPVSADAPTFAEALAADSVLAVITDDPSAAVPPQVMTDIARLWIADLGLTDARIVSAPLAWRDPVTNAALAARLGRALGGSPTLFLDADDASTAAGCWRSVRA